MGAYPAMIPVAVALCGTFPLNLVEENIIGGKVDRTDGIVARAAELIAQTGVPKSEWNSKRLSPIERAAPVCSINDAASAVASQRAGVRSPTRVKPLFISATAAARTAPPHFRTGLAPPGFAQEQLFAETEAEWRRQAAGCQHHAAHPHVPQPERTTPFYRKKAMLDAPFLTDLDSRAAVKGSRDPLGIQPIWTRFGRHVVGNLTTVSNSVRDFTPCYSATGSPSALPEQGTGRELATFLKWEQLAAYARAGVEP